MFINYDTIGKGLGYGFVVWVLLAMGYFSYKTLSKFIKEIIKKKKTKEIMDWIDSKYPISEAKKDDSIRYLREKYIIKYKISKYELECYQNRKRKNKIKKLKEEKKKNGITKSIKKQKGKYWDWFKRTFKRKNKADRGQQTGENTTTDGDFKQQRILQIPPSRKIRRNKGKPQYIEQQHSQFN